jgi:hypothetical protein
MRRFAILMALALGLTILSGCTGVNFSDPVHPHTRLPGSCILP